MARLQISGQVRYANRAPAAQARVRVYDLDGLDNSGEHDFILDKSTNEDGRYAGQSSEWKDSEGQVLGINVPDVLRLQFLVNVDGKSHQGTLFRSSSTGSCVDIVLPFQPRKPVRKTDRELIQVITLSDKYEGGERALNQFIETATEGLTSTVLGGLYRKVTFVKGADATLEGFVQALQAATGRSATEAVDVIFTTHGRSDRLYFFGASYAEADLLTALTTGLTAQSRGKLRVLFSTACYGKTHLDSWIAAGFNEASGSVGIYADSAVSYLRSCTHGPRSDPSLRRSRLPMMQTPQTWPIRSPGCITSPPETQAASPRATVTATDQATAEPGFTPHPDIGKQQRAWAHSVNPGVGPRACCNQPIERPTEVATGVPFRQLGSCLANV